MHFQPPVSASLIEEIFRSRKHQDKHFLSKNMWPHCVRRSTICASKDDLIHWGIVLFWIMHPSYIQMTWVYIGISSIRNQNIGIFFQMCDSNVSYFQSCFVESTYQLSSSSWVFYFYKSDEGFWCGNSFSSLFELQYNDKKSLHFSFQKNLIFCLQKAARHIPLLVA